MSRTLARIHTFTLIFQLEFQKINDLKKYTEDYLKDVENISDDNKNFICLEFEGTYNNLDTIDSYISENLRDWNIDRINKVDLAILRLAIYEIIYNDTIPNSVSINEAIEICKKYSSTESASFVNGVLGSVCKSI